LVNALLLKIESQAILIRNVPEEFHYERDPKDEPYVNLALVTNASYLVSQDKDLLDLMTTSSDVALQFRFRYPFLRILKAADFVTEIERERGHDLRGRRYRDRQRACRAVCKDLVQRQVPKSHLSKKSKRKDAGELESSAPVPQGTARRTLSKVLFFLDQANRSERNIEAYECYVEAAVVFARNALFHLRREYGGKLKSNKKSEFDNWITLRERNPLIKDLIDKRDNLIHARTMSIIPSPEDTWYLEISIDEASPEIKAAHERLRDQLNEIEAIIDECERRYK
jgi:hypothetical protein